SSTSSHARSSLSCLVLVLRSPPSPALCPYTTLFRSVPRVLRGVLREGPGARGPGRLVRRSRGGALHRAGGDRARHRQPQGGDGGDRKSTRLNSSHVSISSAVFCLKKKTPDGATSGSR